VLTYNNDQHLTTIKTKIYKLNAYGKKSRQANNDKNYVKFRPVFHTAETRLKFRLQQMEAVTKTKTET